MPMPVDESQSMALKARVSSRSPMVRKGGHGCRLPEPSAKLNWTGRIKVVATMLFLVVICLELSNILPAVDAESAVVSAVNDLFLAYTSTVVALLGLRATFFIVDEFVELFSLLKYGVAWSSPV